MKKIFRSKLEKRLEKIYVPILQIQLGLDIKKCEKIFYSLLKQVRLVSKNSPKLPDNYGDILLEKEKLGDDIANELKYKRKMGVTDNDIKRWWNMTSLERSLSMIFENYSKALLFTHLKQDKKLTDTEINKIIQKSYPLYGDLQINIKDISNNDPLPYELKHRVNLYTRKRQKEDPARFQKDIEESFSFNKLIQNEISAGKV